MKTAVSLPDPIFEAAEKLAKKMKLSRSALYARAIEEYVHRTTKDTLTAEIDRVLAVESEESDPFLKKAAAVTLRRAEWKK